MKHGSDLILLVCCEFELPAKLHAAFFCQSAFKTDTLSASNFDPLDAEQARRRVVFM